MPRELVNKPVQSPRCKLTAPTREILSLKILYTNFHNGDGGGHTTYIMNLARALAPRHEIFVAAPASSRLYQAASAIPGVQVIDLAFNNRLPTVLRTTKALRGLIARHGFDVIHVNGSADHRMAMLAIIGKGKQRPRIVYTKHNDLPVTGLATWLKARFATDCVICVCEYTRRKLAQTAYAHGALRVVYNGIDLARYAPLDAAATQAARAQWLPANEQHVLALGSNAGTPDYKGWLDLVEAVSTLPDDLRRQVRIVMAGETPSARQVERVAALGMTERVTFSGLLDDVRPLVAALDIGFVISHQETISFACREMMAMGKPALVSDVGGLPENVTPGVDGWVVPARNPAALAQWLTGILAQRDQLPAMAHAARDKAVREFSLDTFVQGTEQVYRDLLAAR
ncbi:glycosyltransferase [Silvimonas sp.]|uniref:glycosyltransferase n=1 Tax=Silvimonas sp. TaxID=2650811 RepID=UPI002851A127|nr:glycosyltransferase [Silvimonas sp.]MDR3429874.1 glycosyltransferase [Silvimonas sp.]